MALFEIDLLQIFLGSRQELKRFFIRRVQCSETAADLVQEVYLRLPLLTPPPSSEPAARAWMFKVAGNLAIDHARRQKRHGELLAEHFDVDRDIEGSPTPDQFALDREQLGQVQNALAQLPAQCAEVLYLSRVEGLSHAEIADKLGISKSWVEKQLMRALNHCRRAVDEKYG